MKDWTFEQLAEHATWLVIQNLIKGNLRDGVELAILLTLDWRKAKDEMH